MDDCSGNKELTAVETPDELYKQLVSRIKEYHPTDNFVMLNKAYEIAKEAHKEQKRRSGEPYIIHPLKVAFILADLELDMESIEAGLLHDTIEDTPYTYEDISKIFGEEVAILVDGVTKLGKLSYTTKEEIQAENYRKMFLAMAKDIRVILIKLADRLHNMRTLNYMTEAKQKEKAQETMDIYAPLAHRLGISKIRTEMEDLCFKYLNPEAYYDLKGKIEKKKSEREQYVKQIVIEIDANVKEADIEGTVYGRSKHFFSIYKKMVNQNKTLDQIYDLFAVRIIVNTVKDCYAVLGIVHDMYKPVPGRFKDYIAMPKPNMYQSLHNTLIGPTGEPFEVQIRTWDMHRTSEYGIAAHWKYKEGRGGETTQNREEEKLSWLRQILEWQKDLSDNKEFMTTLKSDLDIFNDSVYAFTPQGKVIPLPNGSTPIDFAYSIHSAVGNKMVGARVNNKIVTFDYKIQNGDIVEIITSQNSRGPSRDWLSLVKSSTARTKINQWFKKEFKEENIVKGKELIISDSKKKGYSFSDLSKSEWIEIVVNKFGFRDWDALCAAVGHGGVKEGQVSNRLIEEYLKEERKSQTAVDYLKKLEEKTNAKPSKRSDSGVVVKGIGDVSVRFSRCCNPVPGDEIIGFVTRGRGVSIHRTDCANIINLTEDDRNRLLEAEWEMSAGKEGIGPKFSFQAEIRLLCADRNNIILDLSRVLSEENLPVKSFNARSTKDLLSIVNIVLEITSKDQLEKVCVHLKNVKGVEDIERVSS
ncbi:MAG: bifunctional (p)ppGpp synthetase/guanosine-3',5'-bis(diphosphate) 3'-pyrophosphohydrolase [Candidatus Metalachnospira sp.]|nr:bifunctional (p)ppGpp synthetase/guanosine-3',5'-bis(diphosphate) 3'-pyrophosphohydrolase [Candidatus Metalachnospira sp.]